MAKNLLVSIVAFVLCVTVLATEMVVKQKNGENWRINVNEVEEIIFDESIPEDSAIVDTSVTPLKFKILSDSTAEVINDDSYREDAFPESITIPAKVRIEGKIYNVISIGDYAFRDCNGLISIKIPNIGYSLLFQQIKQFKFRAGKLRLHMLGLSDKAYIYA